MDTQTIYNSELIKIYNEGNPKTKASLEEKFGKKLFCPENLLLTTWQEVCEIKKLDPIHSLPYVDPKNEKQEFYNAVFILTETIEVLNGGWVPDWNNSNEYKYYPWFDMSGAGFSFDGCGNVNASASVGSRLVFKDKETMLHAVKYFLPYYEIMFKK